METGPAVTDSGSTGLAPPRRERPGLIALALILVSLAAGWYLLTELAIVLWPLVLAGLLVYVILPLHRRIKRRVPAAAAVVVLLAVTIGLLFLVAGMIYQSLAELNADLPRLIARVRGQVEQVRSYAQDHLPSWLLSAVPQGGDAGSAWVDRLRGIAGSLVNTAANAFGESVIVTFYLIFLLLESRRFPERLRAALSPERAEHVSQIMARINENVSGYLWAKTQTSLIMAIPSAIVLWWFGVKFALMWSVLIFAGNFVPYIGALITVLPPLLLAFIDLDPLWRPVMVSVLMGLIQVVTNNFIEPALVGKSVNLSPLVVMVALAFWGLCWGVPGMFLAVPLTAVLKIVGEQTSYTRPIARLMADEA